MMSSDLGIHGERWTAKDAAGVGRLALMSWALDSGGKLIGLDNTACFRPEMAVL